MSEGMDPHGKAFTGGQSAESIPAPFVGGVSVAPAPSAPAGGASAPDTSSIAPSAPGVATERRSDPADPTKASGSTYSNHQVD